MKKGKRLSFQPSSIIAIIPIADFPFPVLVDTPASIWDKFHFLWLFVL